MIQPNRQRFSFEDWAEDVRRAFTKRRFSFEEVVLLFAVAGVLGMIAGMCL